jgi:hypothetical protein
MATLAAMALLGAPAARAGSPLQDLSVDDWCEVPGPCRVIFLDPQGFDPEAFSDSRIGSIVCDKDVNGSGDDLYTYSFSTAPI